MTTLNQLDGGKAGPVSREVASDERTLTAWLRLSRAPHPHTTHSSAHTTGLPAHAAHTLRLVRTILVTALAVLVAVIALLAFVASFDKISAYAVAEVAWPTRLRWIPPLLVDSFTVVGTLLVVWLSLSGAPRRKATGYGWLLVAAGTAASVIVNIEHAPDTLAGRIIAGSPPVALLLAIEALVLVLRYLLIDLAAGASATAQHRATHLVPTQPDAPASLHAHTMRIPAEVVPEETSNNDVPAPELRARPTHSTDERSAATAADGEPSAALRAHIEQIWRTRERDGGQRLVGAQLARELRTPARHVQAVLRDLRRHSPGAVPGPREGTP
jgi:hypothetical protein